MRKEMVITKEKAGNGKDIIQIARYIDGSFISKYSFDDYDRKTAQKAVGELYDKGYVLDTMASDRQLAYEIA